MIDQLKQSYRELKASPPGKRFQELHRRRARGSEARRPLVLSAATIVLATGVVFLIVPGPGIPLVILGFSLIAQELLPVARALDWLELRLREAFGRKGPARPPAH